VLRIGCLPDLPLQRLQSLLGALYARDGKPGAEVLHLRSPEQLSRLLAGDLDAAVIHHRREIPGVEMRPLFANERLCAYVPVGHPLVAPSPGDFEHDTLLVPPRITDPPLHDWLLATLDDAGCRFRAVRETGAGDWRDVLLAVAEGRGVSLAPASMLDVIGGAAAIVTRREIEPAVPGPDTVIAWRKDAHARLEELLAAAGDLHGA
jgi:DNA-binding transcriptional LysR family regulator